MQYTVVFHVLTESLIPLAVDLVISFEPKFNSFVQDTAPVRRIQSRHGGVCGLERALLASSPKASGEATTPGELVIEWLKITPVPLLVCLIGACVWSCFEKFSTWRNVTEDGGSERIEAADSSRSVDSNHVARDLEAGLELSHSVSEMAAAALANVKSTDVVTTDSVSTNEITSDIGHGLHR